MQSQCSLSIFFTERYWGVLVTLIVGSWLGQVDAARDICSKNSIGGPCLLLPRPANVTTNPPTKAPTDSAYCSLACSQKKAEMFSSICPCASISTTDGTTITSTTTVTTTTMLTTTPQPVTCYYGTQRPNRLSGKTRRLYSSVPVLIECDYPGLIGVFWEYENKILPACVGLLLEENRILISRDCFEQYCTDGDQLYAQANSYTFPRTKTDITIDTTTAKRLDMGGSQVYFYTVNLSTSLTFDKTCVQPVCVPNINIPVDDIDLEDCRIVGYGVSSDEDDAINPLQLQEIKVRVDRNSIKNTNLTVERIDNKSDRGLTCVGDESAPLICSHRDTKEWVTVGATILTSLCKSDPPPDNNPTVTSFLQESNKEIYNAIQRFKYADPRNFPADITN